MYLYETTLYRDTADVIGASASNAVDLADFENNRKASAYSITDLAIAETTISVVKTYTDFKNLITGGILWGDVKYKTTLLRYDLYILSENQL